MGHVRLWQLNAQVRWPAKANREVTAPAQEIVHTIHIEASCLALAHVLVSWCGWHGTVGRKHELKCIIHCFMGVTYLKGWSPLANFSRSLTEYFQEHGILIMTRNILGCFFVVFFKVFFCGAFSWRYMIAWDMTGKGMRDDMQKMTTGWTQTLGFGSWCTWCMPSTNWATTAQSTSSHCGSSQDFGRAIPKPQF